MTGDSEMSNTQELFREDSYVKSCDAEVLGVNDLGGIILDKTVFYPASGGQPGDAGALMRADGTQIQIATTVYESDRSTIVHVPAEGAGVPAAGEKVQCVLDWDRRYAHMRVHTALHLLCAALPYPVTGGSIGDGQGRLDFDIPDAGLDKGVLSEELTKLVERDLPVTVSWITDEELEAQPDLVRTMAVKPPSGSGRVRMIAVGDVDFQPCGGTHVANTREIGSVQVSKIEKKGAQNRRVRIKLP
jgi:misacylated tRNA(Ala) deacylase